MARSGACRSTTSSGSGPANEGRKRSRPTLSPEGRARRRTALRTVIREDAQVQIKADREALLQTSLAGAELRAALTSLYAGWLAGLLGDVGPGVALVAV